MAQTNDDLRSSLREVLRSAKHGRTWDELVADIAALADDPAADARFRAACAIDRIVLAEYCERPIAEREQVYRESVPLLEAVSLAEVVAGTMALAASDTGLTARYLPPLRERLDAALAAPDAPDREELARLRDDIARILARHGVANGDDGEAP